ncbi:MAG: hypothetical protein H6577_19195 [Lewinellaceae bacterium]|nr:hypothetical protein [Saprospiraceae bacterium]MCB9340252.1 hypothetical protein [Lewinellaceae bacterium]
MSKLHFLLLILPIYISCNHSEGGQPPPPASSSEAKVDPLKDVSALYSGLVTFDENKSEISVSSSPKLEQMADMISLPASHIAWLFYKNLKECPYDSIRVALHLTNGSNPVFSFPKGQLKIVNERIKVYDEVGELFKNGDYNRLYKMFAPDVAAQMTQHDLGTFCNEVFESNGKPVGYTFQGFTFFNLSGKNKELIHMAGMLHRVKQDTPLSLYVDPENGQLYSIKFDY